jgi:hypothetical protein
MPLMSHEVRWFFPGEVARFPELQDWIKTAKPFVDEGQVAAPAAEGRLDDKPDVYLLVPGADDIGIKWREGQLQVKGRMARRGLQRFGSRFYGAVEVWAKWSYQGGDIKRAFEGWFGASAATWETVDVRKTRTLRKVRLDSRRKFVEVSKDAYPDRGLGVELTDLEIGGQRYCSLGFEAFPDDTEMADSFTAVVNAWLDDLAKTHAVLAEHQSMGYPEFLNNRTRFQFAAVGRE